MDKQNRDSRRTNAELDSAELRQQVLTTLSLLLMAATYVGWWQASGNIEPYGRQFLLFFSLFVINVAVFGLRRSYPMLASFLLMASLTSGYAVMLRVFPYPIAPFLVVLPVIASFAISPALGGVAAVANTSILIAMRGLGVEVLAILGLVMLTALIEWLSQRKLYTVLRWSWDNQFRAEQLLTVLRERQGELNRTLEALTEATRRLGRTNAELAIARKEAELARTFKDQFAANVSHELRTPLNLITGFSEMMYLTPEVYDGVKWTPDLELDLGEMYKASQHLQSLVNDVLDLSRIDARRMPMFRELVDLRTIIDDAGRIVQSLFDQHHLFFLVDCPEDLPQLLLDRTRILQVLVNLLNNAVRFTETGGIRVQIQLEGNLVTVSVRDTGTGIPEEDLAHIFEEYRQVDGVHSLSGAGLGLTISRQFVTLHGGDMWVESVPGQGSDFRFTLPLPGFAPPSVLLQHVPSRTPEDAIKAPLILVDRDPSIAAMMARYMGDIPTLAASSVAEAEDCIDELHPRAIIVNNPPDTPDTDWLGVLGESSRASNVPILRCSIPSPSWLMQSIGIDGCLTKPVSRKDIAEVIEGWCDNAATVLVVDDDRGFVALLTRMLGTIAPNLRVLCAYGGAEALEMARTHQPSLVLLDLIMPGLDGFEVAQSLRQDDDLAGTAIVAVTATSYAEEILVRHGSYLTLTQPNGISAGTLADLMAQIVRIVRPNYVQS